ncbi:hypothetical protein EC968_005695 [Mortierella alpina]|nr:hypothetical protein EC968_005695 [Mortierella alpina]
MKASLTGRQDIDRNINTDKYDFDTILLMESEINMAKKNIPEFKDPSAFNLSKESFKPKWAVKILRADLEIDRGHQFNEGWSRPKIDHGLFSPSTVQGNSAPRVRPSTGGIDSYGRHPPVNINNDGKEVVQKILLTSRPSLKRPKLRK